MKKRKGMACLAAVLCIVIGAALILAVLQKNDFDWRRLDTVQATERTYTVDEPFTSVSADCASADLTLILDASGETVCRAVCTELDGIHFDVQVRDSVLHVTCVDERTVPQRIGIITQTPKATLYIKNARLDALTAESGSGDVRVENGLSFRAVSVTTGSGDVGFDANAETVTVTTGSGDADLNGGTPQTVTLTTGSGTMKMNYVQAAQCIRIQSSSGDVSLLCCDAPAFDVQTQSGDVTGWLPTGKRYDVQTGSGDVSVPPDGDGGICTVRTSSGDVTFQ